MMPYVGYVLYILNQCDCVLIWLIFDLFALICACRQGQMELRLKRPRWVPMETGVGADAMAPASKRARTADPSTVGGNKIF